MSNKYPVLLSRFTKYMALERGPVPLLFCSVARVDRTHGQLFKELGAVYKCSPFGSITEDLK